MLIGSEQFDAIWSNVHLSGLVGTDLNLLTQNFALYSIMNIIDELLIWQCNVIFMIQRLSLIKTISSIDNIITNDFVN